jgi:hypothetical protein
MARTTRVYIVDTRDDFIPCSSASRARQLAREFDGAVRQVELRSHGNDLVLRLLELLSPGEMEALVVSSKSLDGP